MHIFFFVFILQAIASSAGFLCSTEIAPVKLCKWRCSTELFRAGCLLGCLSPLSSIVCFDCGQTICSLKPKCLQECRNLWLSAVVWVCLKTSEEGRRNPSDWKHSQAVSRR